MSDPVSNSPEASVMPSTPEEAIARPVMVHTTMVSQNVPVILIYPWRTGLSVVAAAAVIAAEPMPASLEKTPRATPYLMALIMDATMEPQRPPPTAFTENAI